VTDCVNAPQRSYGCVFGLFLWQSQKSSAIAQTHLISVSLITADFPMRGVNGMATRNNEKKSRIARDFRRVLIVLVIIFVAILGRQEYKIYQIQKETEATQKRVEELQKVQADLEAERKRLYDPKYIEKLAREDHNYVKKDEVPIFIVKDKEKQDDKTKKGDAKGKN
jgi:cell division protein FtsB